MAACRGPLLAIYKKTQFCYFMMAWAYLLVVTVAEVDLQVPHLARNCTGTADQIWKIDVKAGTIKNGDKCLEPMKVGNTWTAALAPCSSPAKAAWTISKSAPMSFEANSVPACRKDGSACCLTQNPHVWPVPAGRNFLLQLTKCNSKDQAQQFAQKGSLITQTGTEGLAPVEWCLDGGLTSGVPPPALKCCEHADVKDAAFCNPALSHAQRAADLEALLTVSEIAGLLSMSMPRVETPVGTTLLNQRFTTPIDRLHIPSFQFSEACHGILAGCLRGTADSTGCPSSFPMPIGQAASFNETLWIKVATAISDEARALQNGGVTGVNFFAPNINVRLTPLFCLRAHRSCIVHCARASATSIQYTHSSVIRS
jgi:hypothetical protein